jgi:hypothetical protein
MRVLIDTDVLIDVALEREGFFNDSNRILEWIESGAGQGAVAWHSLSNLAYMMMTDARGFIRDLLQFVDVAPSGVEEVLAALDLPMKDLEDAMQGFRSKILWSVVAGHSECRRLQEVAYSSSISERIPKPISAKEIGKPSVKAFVLLTAGEYCPLTADVEGPCSARGSSASTTTPAPSSHPASHTRPPSQAIPHKHAPPADGALSSGGTTPRESTPRPAAR